MQDRLAPLAILLAVADDDRRDHMLAVRQIPVTGMNWLLLAVCIVAAFVAVVLGMRLLEPPRSSKPLPAEISTFGQRHIVEQQQRILKADKEESEVRVIPITKQPKSVVTKIEEKLPESPPLKIEPKIEPPKADPPKVEAQVARRIVRRPPPEHENNEGVCGRYGGHKVFTHRHGWTSWHCVYPHGR